MKNYKGIILAGGSGTRLHPLTQSISKQLLPIYNKPMIYYPLSVLMTAGIQDILVISTPTDLPFFQRILGDGSHLGIQISYEEQPEPEGLAQAFIIGEDFIKTDNVCMILGDNIFHGPGFDQILQRAQSRDSGATVFGFPVEDPQRFGVATFNQEGEVTAIKEKPDHPESNIAITGLYFYDNRVIEIAKNIKPSPRNELEITDIHNEYLNHKSLNIEILSDDFVWLDTGTYDSLLEAGNFVQNLSRTTNHQLGCIEEISFQKGWISPEDMSGLASLYSKTSYGEYLFRALNQSS